MTCVMIHMAWGGGVTCDDTQGTGTTSDCKMIHMAWGGGVTCVMIHMALGQRVTAR